MFPVHRFKKATAKRNAGRWTEDRFTGYFPSTHIPQAAVSTVWAPQRAAWVPSLLPPPKPEAVAGAGSLQCQGEHLWHQLELLFLQ